MIYTVKNGIFKHTLNETAAAQNYVAVKLYTNGWAITNPLGTILDSVLYDGKDGIASNRWKAEMIHEENPAVFRAPIVEELVLTTEHTVLHLHQDRSRSFTFTMGNESYSIDGILSRTATFNLPDDFSPLDAMRLFCFLQIAAHDDDLFIV